MCFEEIREVGHDDGGCPRVNAFREFIGKRRVWGLGRKNKSSEVRAEWERGRSDSGFPLSYWDGSCLVVDVMFFDINIKVGFAQCILKGDLGDIKLAIHIEVSEMSTTSRRGNWSPWIICGDSGPGAVMSVGDTPNFIILTLSAINCRRDGIVLENGLMLYNPREQGPPIYMRMVMRL